MKKSAYIFSLGLLLVMAACNKKLDVQPQNQITPDQIKTSSDVLAILAGGYAQMQNSAAFGEKFIDMSDLIASEDQGGGAEDDARRDAQARAAHDGSPLPTRGRAQPSRPYVALQLRRDSREPSPLRPLRAHVSRRRARGGSDRA